MICNKCKAKVNINADYCHRCAAFIIKKTKKHKKSLKISNYYGRQFHNIQLYKKPEFNFAAYLLFPLHLIYRKCFARFLYLAFPIIFVWSLCTLFISLVPFGYNLYAFFYAPSVFCPLVFICLAIYNGVSFNRYYYHKFCGNAHVPTNKTGVVIFLAALLLFVALVIVLFFISRIIYINNMYYIPYYNYMPELPNLSAL